MDELYVDWLFKVNIGSSLDNNLHHHRIPQRVHDMLLVYKHQKRKRIDTTASTTLLPREVPDFVGVFGVEGGVGSMECFAAMFFVGNC